MPHDVPDSEPTEIRAGESWQWDRTLSEHPPSDGWTLKYALRGPTDGDITASTSDETYEIREAPGNTDFTPGHYRLVGYVQKESGGEVTEREVIYEGTVHVLPNPITAVNSKTHAEKVYESITAMIEGTASKEQRRLRINGREIERISISELLRLRNVYADQVRMERHPGQLSPGVEARFARP